MLRKIILAFIFGYVLMWLFPLHYVLAQDMSGHPHRDQAIHEKFYITWMRPNHPGQSCCSMNDCAPAESKLVDGHWFARKVDDKGDFIPIPDDVIERDRDTPDGRSHLCAVTTMSGPTVLCFIPGAGG